MQTIRSTLIVMAFFGSTLAAAGGLPDTRVQYRASDLASPAGVSAVYTKLTAAAEQTCAQLNGMELARQRVYHKCIDAVLADALRKVRSPALAALHEARTGERVDVLVGSVKVAGDLPHTGIVSR